MNAALVSLGVLACGLNGVTTAVQFEQVCNFIFMRRDPHDIPATVQPADINGVGAFLILLGATTPYWLEQISQTLLAVPWDRTIVNGITGVNNRPEQLRRASIDANE